MKLAVSLAYLLAAVLFILGLSQLSSPKGARRGNQTAAVESKTSCHGFDAVAVMSGV